MDGYEVHTSDDGRAGHVVGERGDALVIESGTIFKHRHLLPRAFVEVDESQQVVRSTLSKELIQDSPRFDGDEIDVGAVMSHYGLVGTEVAPPTQGYGDVNADDPARTADQQLLRDGGEPAESRRARMRAELTDNRAPQTSGPAIGGEGER
jgi:hypothetical protein